MPSIIAGGERFTLSWGKALHETRGVLSLTLNRGVAAVVEGGSSGFASAEATECTGTSFISGAGRPRSSV
jgi:hypothetical protein